MTNSTASPITTEALKPQVRRSGRMVLHTEVVTVALVVSRFAGQRGFAGCACNSRNKEMPPICPFSVGYHPLLSDSADDGVHCLAARLAARSALAQLHS